MPCADCSTDDDRGCFCGPGEMCGDCFESRVQPEDVPKILKVVSEPEPGDAAQVLHKWKGCEQCRHREHPSFCPVCRCLAVTSVEEITRTCQEAGGCPEHPVQEAEEPPLTPEEEEEVPSDSVLPCTCAAVGEEKHAEDCDALLAPYHGEHGYPPEDAPPQPERRPPYAVTYSVSGHLFEVALSGDATVRAVDGALVIQHHLGPVAGIVSVLPVINKED